MTCCLCMGAHHATRCPTLDAPTRQALNTYPGHACGDKRGTLAGASRHLRGFEPLCDDCAVVKREWIRDYTRRRRAA